MRSVVQPVSKINLTDTLTLDGLIHLWGDAGSGKTLLACLIASEVSRHSKVEWINTDAKQSFIPFLKRCIQAAGGSIQNITVTMASERNEVQNLVLGLSQSLSEGVSLIVIDSITRLLDMAREDPILWGRELIEEALPTFAGVVNERGVTIVLISESRALNESRNLAVHHRAIKKWVDHDILLVRNALEDSTRIMRVVDGHDDMEQIGVLHLMDDGIPIVHPHTSRTLGQVGGHS